MLGGVVELAGAVECIDSAVAEKPCLAGERNGPLIPRKRDVDELTGGILSEVNVFLV